ncbi:MAG: tape measure protein [Oscillospiraceae bacterium]|nr:tape measure protein [Oscillospiraceae bacterium]
MKNAADSFGENDRRTQNWQIQLNKAQAELIGMERELKSNNGLLAGYAKEQEAAGRASGSMSDGIKQTNASFKDLGALLKGSYKGALDDSTTGARKVSDAYEGLGGLLKDNVKKSFTDVKETLVGTASKVVTSAGEMGGSIVQFAKDTLSGENTIKAFGDTLREKMEARLNRTAGEADDAADSMDDLGGSVEDAGKEMDDTGKKTSIFGDVLKASLAADAIKAGIDFIVDGIKKIGSAIGDLVLQGGFDRAMNIEQARFKLQGLGHDTDAVDAIMKRAGASVKGTAYSLSDATSVAAGLVAAGVDAGDSLERSLKLVADASAISGRSMDEMGMIFNKIAASGKMSANEMNQMMKAGIPIQQLLADTMGVSAEKVRELVSEGKVGLPEFQDAIEKGMGGAALKVGETFQGAVANFKTSFARMGADFIGPFTTALTPAIGIVTGIVDDIASGSTDKVQEKVKDLGKFLTDAVSGLVKQVGPILTTAMAVLPDVVMSVVPALKEVLPLIVSTVTELFGQVLQMLLILLPELIPVAVDAVMTIVGALIENLPLLITAAVQVVVALVQGIAKALPDLIPAAVNAIVTIVQGLLDNLPLILDAALQLILGLAEGLLAALPDLIAALPAIIDSIITFVLEAIPQIIEAGIALLTSLVEALPDIIQAIVVALPEIIDSIITALLENIPLIIEAGISLLTALIGALPEIIITIVEALPEIISGILGGLLGALPQLIEAGWQLLMGLLEGIFKAVPELLKGVWEVCKALWNSVLEFFGIRSPSTLFADIGGNLVRGLWNGISDMTQWIKDKIFGFARGITDSIKSFFGIASPSKLFRDQIGANLAFGLGEGFEEAMKDVTRDMQDAVPTDFDIDTNVKGAMNGSLGGGGGGFTLVLNIGNFINNTAQDLRQLADELSTIMAGEIRRKELLT